MGRRAGADPVSGPAAQRADQSDWRAPEEERQTHTAGTGQWRQRPARRTRRHHTLPAVCQQVTAWLWKETIQPVLQTSAIDDDADFDAENGIDEILWWHLIPQFGLVLYLPRSFHFSHGLTHVRLVSREKGFKVGVRTDTLAPGTSYRGSLVRHLGRGRPMDGSCPRGSYPWER